MEAETMTLSSTARGRMAASGLDMNGSDLASCGGGGAGTCFLLRDADVMDVDAGGGAK